MNIFKRLCSYLAYKESLMKRIIETEDDLDAKIFYALEKIEALDQDKLYAFKIESKEAKDMVAAKRMLAQVKQRIQWDMPNFLIHNGELSEISKSDLEEAFKIFKKGE